MLVHQLLERSATLRPDALAVLEPQRTITYGALETLANRFCAMCVSEGVTPGDRVVLALDNSIELIAGYFGVMKAGATAVPLPPGSRSDRLPYALGDCSPALCVVDDSARAFPAGQTVRSVRPRDAFVHPPASVRPQVLESDLAAIIYTSGSTGVPQGVMLTHANIVANTESIQEYLHLTALDRVMCILPLYYVYGLSLLHTHVSVGGSIILDNRFAYPDAVLRAMFERGATGFAGVPSTFSLLLHRSRISEMNFPNLRYITQAGGAMLPACIRRWIERVPEVPLFVMYGATEASARLTFLPPECLLQKMGSIGRPIRGVQIAVLKDNGSPVVAREVGELVARGANISPGYWNAPKETRERFGPDGFRTGDLGYVDDDGFLFLVGRKHDMLKVGGHRVAPGEIENVLHQHEMVQEAAVVGMPDPVLGEVPLAFVAARDGRGPKAQELRSYCAGLLPPHKVPTRIVFVHELPKSGAGKIDKAALRARAVTEAGGNAPLHMGV